MSRSRGRGPSWRRRAGRALVWALAAWVLAGAGEAGAESWGGLTPGETTRAGVEAVYGRPTRERSLVEEGRTVAEWTYIAERAPRGFERMVVSYGVMSEGRFVPDVVRSVALYPKPHVFSLRSISNGWGPPEAVGTEEATGRPSFHYRTQGLLIIFDKTGEWAEFMLFGPRLPAGKS
ncbi:MAG TPA: hypothetical protein VHO73_11795 [Methylomirabilota bacterium]|nr:hypothetical protein [Methylomirabilota bacterium]